MYHANTETGTRSRYIPRHLAKAPPLREVFREVFREQARILYAHALAAYRWISFQIDEDMSGPAMALCGLLLGLIVWPVVLYCYFA